MQKYANIPPPLRERGHFCCWRHEEKGGRRTKIPYNPATGQRAQANNPRTFVDFETARQMSSGYDGIGFLITDGLFVIDCDHCRKSDGSLTQTASEIVELFAGLLHRMFTQRERPPYHRPRCRFCLRQEKILDEQPQSECRSVHLRSNQPLYDPHRQCVPRGWVT